MQQPDTGRHLLLTPAQAARSLAISPRKLWSMTNAGEIRCVRLGRCVRYHVTDLEAAIERLKKASEH